MLNDRHARTVSSSEGDQLAVKILYVLPTDGRSIHQNEITTQLKRQGYVQTEEETSVGLERLADLGMIVRIDEHQFARADRQHTSVSNSSAFAQLVTQIAATFIHNDQHEVDSLITDALRRITEFTGDDRGYVYEYDFENNVAHYKYEWCANGVSAQIDLFPSAALADISDEIWVEPHQRGETVIIRDVASLPDEGLRQYLACQDIKSLVAVPIFSADQCLGFMGFDSVRQSRQYSQEEVYFLEILAGILSTLKRREADRQALEQTRNNLDIVVQGAGVGTWIWWLHSGHLEVNEYWATMLGYSLDELGPISIETWRQLTHPDDRAAGQALVAKNVAGTLKSYDTLVRMRHKDGQWRWVQVRGRTVRQDPVEGPVAVGVNQDVTERVLAQQALEQSEQNFRKFLEDLPNVAVQGYNRDKQITFWNRGSETLYGYSANEALGKNLIDLCVFEDHKPRISADIDRWVNGGPEISPSEMKLHDKNGTTKYVYSSYALQRRSPSDLNLYRIDVDLTSEKIAQRRIELLARAFTHSYDGVLIADSQLRIVDVNERFCQITDCTHDEVIGESPATLYLGGQEKTFYETLLNQLEKEGHWVGQIWNRKKSGEQYAIEARITSLKDEQGQTVNYIANVTDITERLNHEKKLKQAAFFDELTDLPNRRSIESALHEIIENFSQESAPLAVVFIDLDEFKSINDLHDYEIGDRYLREVSRRLSSTLLEADFVARFGGDEFVLIFRTVNQPGALDLAIERLRSVIQVPMVLEGQTFRLTASFGVTCYPQEADVDADQLIRQAAQAMYSAKQNGKNKAVFFDSAFERSIVERKNRIEALRAAIENDEMVLHYQPQVDMSARKVVGVEALVRWNHPEEGLLYPASFIDLIQDDENLGQSLTRWVLARALVDLKRLKSHGHQLGMSVNIIIPSHEMTRNSFLQELQTILKPHPDLDPALLTLEIVENILIEDLSQTTKVISEIQNLGFKVSLDDFGTGFSSLSNLKHLSFDELKIDQEFVRDMLNDRDDMTIVQAVISISQAFNVPVIAEGVETEEHAAMLLCLGCTKAQGYVIARPLAFDALLDWLPTWSPVASWGNIAPISKELHPFVAMLSEHTGRIAVLEKYIQNEPVEPPEFETKLSEFDKIVHLLEVYGLRSESAQAIRAVEHHTKLCVQGSEAVRAFKAGHQKEAQQLFTETLDTSLRLRALLWGFGDQAGSPKDQ